MCSVKLCVQYIQAKLTKISYIETLFKIRYIQDYSFSGFGFDKFHGIHVLCLPPLLWGDILFLSCPSVHHTVCQRNSSETTEQNFMKLGSY